jgi:hypothetical protein
MFKKPLQVLFFVDGTAPTHDDIVAASQLNAHVMFRNARAVPAEGSLEKCDGVAGHVPPRYAATFPTAEAAIAARAAEMAALATKTGDTPAPVAPKAVAPAADAAAAPAQAQAAGAGVPAAQTDAKPADAKPAGPAWNKG